VYYNPTQVYVNPTQVGRLLADLAGVSNDEIVLLSETLLPDRTLEACFAVTNIVNPTVSAFPPHLAHVLFGANSWAKEALRREHGPVLDDARHLHGVCQRTRITHFEGPARAPMFLEIALPLFKFRNSDLIEISIR
jgi:hypothetical protein